MNGNTFLKYNKGSCVQQIPYLNIYEKLFWLISVWLQLALILTIFLHLS